MYTYPESGRLIENVRFQNDYCAASACMSPESLCVKLPLMRKHSGRGRSSSKNNADTADYICIQHGCGYRKRCTRAFDVLDVGRTHCPAEFTKVGTAVHGRGSMTPNAHTCSYTRLQCTMRFDLFNRDTIESSGVSFMCAMCTNVTGP